MTITGCVTLNSMISTHRVKEHHGVKEIQGASYAKKDAPLMTWVYSKNNR